MNYGKEFTKGILKENPTLVGLLGMCPTLAVTTAAFNGIGMGLSTMFVLICSNVVISLLRKVIPEQVKTPLLYRNHCFVRNGHSVSGARLCAGVVYQSGSISGTDHSQLYHSGTGGNVRLQE